MPKKKEKEFNFDKTYDCFMEKAKEYGLESDMVFQTLMKEFKRTKYMCDELFKGIEEQGVAYVESGSMAQKTFKANPLNKDYLNANKSLTNICDKIEDLLAKIPKQESNDWL